MSGLFFESQTESYANSKKKLIQTPFFLPSRYRHINIVGVVRTYDLSIIQRIFITFHDSRASLIGIIFRVVSLTAVLVNASAFLISWSPPYMVFPDTCEHPVCSYDEQLCNGKIKCAPEIDQDFIKIQKICIFIFLFEYLVTACTCWSVPARLAGVLDLYFEKHKDKHEFEFNMNSNTPENSNGNSNNNTVNESSGNENAVPSLINISGRLSIRSGEISWMTSGEIDAEIDSDPIYPPVIQICRFLTTGKNIRTIVAILPFIIVSQLHPTHFSNVNIFFTIGRLMTLFKLVDFISSRRSSFIVNNTILRAYPTLLYMVWTILIVATIMASVIFVMEKGEYTVNEDYPDGAYLRPNILNSEKEESPFSSILISMYFVVVTMTSTGYGDLVCTSAIGRALSNILMCSAIFILALPIAVLGNILSEEVDKYSKRKTERESAIIKQLKRVRTFPVYKYRRAAPSFVGAKQVVGETMRRLSAITINSNNNNNSNLTPKSKSKTLPQQFNFSSNDKNTKNIIENTNSNNSNNNINGNNGNNNNMNGNRPQRRGSDSVFERRISTGTLEKMRRLSLNSQLQFVDTSDTNTSKEDINIKQSRTTSVQFNEKYIIDILSNDPDSDINEIGMNDFMENGITLNPINSSSKSKSTIRLSPIPFKSIYTPNNSTSQKFDDKNENSNNSNNDNNNEDDNSHDNNTNVIRSNSSSSPPPLSLQFRKSSSVSRLFAQQSNLPSSNPSFERISSIGDSTITSSEIGENSSQSNTPSNKFISNSSFNTVSSSSSSLSNSSSSKLASSSSLFISLHEQINDIDKQIQKLQEKYDHKYLECMEISQNIVTQMKIKNNLLRSLQNNIENEKETIDSQHQQLKNQNFEENNNNNNDNNNKIISQSNKYQFQF